MEAPYTSATKVPTWVAGRPMSGDAAGARMGAVNTAREVSAWMTSVMESARSGMRAQHEEKSMLYYRHTAVLPVTIRTTHHTATVHVCFRHHRLPRHGRLGPVTGAATRARRPAAAYRAGTCTN